MNELEVKELLKKARQSLDAAKLLHTDGFHDFSASRSYYAMFYTVEALLLFQNLTFSKHSATIAAFGKEFIKTNLLPAKLHQYILEAFDLRNIGDYGAMNSVNQVKAEELIQNAGEMIDIIQAYLFPNP
ncbi:MAG TPA: HEPN domain-containing protein [Bacillota bacterium]|nr:HEPN domain-containing protein [Bacillota bacterium]